MNSLVFGFRDSLVGFSTFFVAPNDAVAKRTFYSFCKNSSSPEFFSLYQLAEFHSDTGNFMNLCSPLFICSGEDILIDPLFYRSEDKE